MRRALRCARCGRSAQCSGATSAVSGTYVSVILDPWSGAVTCTRTGALFKQVSRMARSRLPSRGHEWMVESAVWQEPASGPGAERTEHA